MKETYPFSHFPMYAAQASKVSCIFVTDKDDNILPCFHTFGQTSPMFTKFINGWQHRIGYRSSMRPGSDYHPYAAEQALSRFYHSAKKKKFLDKVAPIKLWEHHIRLLPNNTLFEKKQVLVILGPNGVPLDLPDIGQGIVVPEFDDELLKSYKKSLVDRKSNRVREQLEEDRELFIKSFLQPNTTAA